MGAPASKPVILTWSLASISCSCVTWYVCKSCSACTSSTRLNGAMTGVESVQAELTRSTVPYMSAHHTRPPLPPFDVCGPSGPEWPSRGRRRARQRAARSPAALVGRSPCADAQARSRADWTASASSRRTGTTWTALRCGARCGAAVAVADEAAARLRHSTRAADVPGVVSGPPALSPRIRRPRNSRMSTSHSATRDSTQRARYHQLARPTLPDSFPSS